ncbi:MAG: tetratricopeptide repeat protein, partial [Promethearchaeota archaeon]
MPYAYPKEVEHVRKLLLEEKTEEAFEILEGFEKTDNFTLRFHGGLFYMLLGNFPKVIEIADRMLEDSQKVNNHFASFDSVRLKWEGFLMMEKFDEIIEMVDFGENYLKLAPKNTSLERKIRETELTHMKGVNFAIESKLDLALTNLEEAVAFFEQNDRYFNVIFAFARHWSVLCLYHKGELDKALLQGNKHLAYLLELKGPKAIPGVYLPFAKAAANMNLGHINFHKGELEKAEEHYINSLKLYESLQLYEWGSLYYLIRISLRKNSLTQAQKYLNQFRTNDFVAGESQISTNSAVYQMSKALILNSSPKLHDKVEAEQILRNLFYQIEHRNLLPQFTVDIYVPIHYCELLLSKLDITHDIKVLDEIEPVITKLLTSAENRRSSMWLAEVKLLQGKLALLQVNMVEARKLLTEAQIIADSHGLHLLAQKISYEHDKLLEEVEMWQSYKDSHISLSERIKHSGVVNVLETMKRNRAIEVPKLEAEIPILLTIMSKTGYVVLTNPFSADITFDENRIGEFVSFFNSISDQMFSESLDRAKFGDHTILLKAHDSLSICYLFEGKSYLAKLRLNSFYEAIKEDSMIMELLNSAIHTGQNIKIEEAPTLEALVAQHFLSAPQEIGISTEPDDSRKLIKESRRIRKQAATKKKKLKKIIIAEIEIEVMGIVLFVTSHLLFLGYFFEVNSPLGGVIVAGIFVQLTLYLGIGCNLIVLNIVIFNWLKGILKNRFVIAEIMIQISSFIFLIIAHVFYLD